LIYIFAKHIENGVPYKKTNNLLNIFSQLIDKIKKDKTKWTKFQDLLIGREISSKTILLQEREIATQIHFIKKGCLREWFNKDGKDITFQFFFEG